MDSSYLGRLHPKTAIYGRIYLFILDDNLGDVPRINGKNGPLDSPRKISNEVFSTTPAFRSPFSTKHTITLTHFAQFVDHDVIKTPALKKPNLVTNGKFLDSCMI